VEYLPRESCALHAVQSGALPPLELLATVPDTMTARSFRILRCSACGVGLTSPYPTEATVAHLYAGRGSMTNFDPIRGTVIDWLKDVFAARELRWIHAKGGRPDVRRVLDFGTGNGRYSLVSARRFRQSSVDAVDFEFAPPPSLEGVDAVRYKTAKDFQRGDTRYDLILLRHVLEHVHDPISFLQALARRLTRRGILYIEVPNLESAYLRYFGVRTNAYSVPYHLWHFDVRSLGMVIQSAGLRCRIVQKDMPLIGGVLSVMFGQQRNLAHQLAGAMLHPLQMILGLFRGKPCLAAICNPE
jgi:SAM-dependent methyltransferase